MRYVQSSLTYMLPLLSFPLNQSGPCTQNGLFKIQIPSPCPPPRLFENTCSLLQPLRKGQLASAWASLCPPLQPHAPTKMEFIQSLESTNLSSTSGPLPISFPVSETLPLPRVCVWVCLNPTHPLVSAYSPPSPGILYPNRGPLVCAHGTPYT